MPGEIVAGDVFEDCRYHPCLCYDIGDPGRDDAVFGISLVDGSTIQCSVFHCGVRKLTPAEAWQWKSEGPADVELEPELRWWLTGTVEGKVAYNGQPITEGFITFHFLSSQPGGSRIKDGWYRADRLPVGAARVTISSKTVQLPACYASEDTSPFTFRVATGSNELNLDIAD
jgi:hypothetical protein